MASRRLTSDQHQWAPLQNVSGRLHGVDDGAVLEDCQVVPDLLALLQGWNSDCTLASTLVALPRKER